MMDIAIAGMGMGGLCLASFLRQEGHRVTLFDQMQKAGPVGSGFVLQPTGLIVLDKLGLRQRAEARGQRLDRMLGKLSKDDKVVLDVGYIKDDYGVAIIRWSLFDLLYEHAVELGAQVEVQHRIIGVDNGPKPQFIFENGTKSANFDLLIDAMGARSPLRATKGKELDYGAVWVNLPWHDNIGFDPTTLEQRYHKASTMIGVLPLGKGHLKAQAMTTFFWSLRHQDHAKWQTDGIDAWVEKIAHFWPQTMPLIENMADYRDQIVYANYRHHTHISPAEGNLVRLGDAWHATSPQLGQGANMAFLDALAFIEAAKRHRERADIIDDYAKRRRIHILFYQFLSCCLTPFYQSDNAILPFLRDYLIAPTLRRRGLVHAMVASMVTGQFFNPIKMAMK
ncbi:NAD(P)/FAD-dependent oxidoreductase [Bartonella sp. HY038]|uniref:FAD-dependent oxidoreductase n=1 Tax=Bartonella sp. HY038 TaxID=2759660 RepID=UPI0015FE6196|nr:NAD(P)/FAD-dependent oxidoreductase [Bartonella sp. HY038]